MFSLVVEVINISITSTLKVMPPISSTEKNITDTESTIK